MAIFSRQKYLKLAKGFRGRAKNCPSIMMPKVEKALQKSYKDRKIRPREYRKQWIMTINAASREHDVSYSNFIKGLNRSNMSFNRKILANLAINEPYSFKAIVDELKVNKEMSSLSKEDMDFSEAVDRNYLVYHEVLPVEPPSLNTIPYISSRTDIPKSEKQPLQVIPKIKSK